VVIGHTRRTFTAGLFRSARELKDHSRRGTHSAAVVRWERACKVSHLDKPELRPPLRLHDNYIANCGSLTDYLQRSASWRRSNAADRIKLNLFACTSSIQTRLAVFEGYACGQASSSLFNGSCLDNKGCRLIN
jgi:hypothetical protein